MAASRGGAVGQPNGGPKSPVEPIEPVQEPVPADVMVERDDLLNRLAVLEALSAEGFLRGTEVSHLAQLGVDPAEAHHLDLIQDSLLQLDEDEMAALGEKGLIISGRRTFPTFAYGYETSYLADLPLYISADPILFTLHKSYDDVLKIMEIDAHHRFHPLSAGPRNGRNHHEGPSDRRL